MGRFDFAEQQSMGPWEDGWYPAVILKEYEAGANNSIFKTEDTLSKNGDSRNITICFGVVRTEKTGFETTETRNISYRLNYIPENLSDERVTEVREYKDKQGKVAVRNWSDKTMQRAFLSYAALHELERILGSELPMNGSGLDVSGLIGHNADVRLETREYNGKRFNDIANVAPMGTKVK